MEIEQRLFKVTGQVHITVPTIDGYDVAQIRAPHPSNSDVHPALRIVDMRKFADMRLGDPMDSVDREIRICDQFCAWVPDLGWRDIMIGMHPDLDGPECWYVASPEDCRGISPIGLYCRSYSDDIKPEADK